jgi:hypothetical protein
MTLPSYIANEIDRLMRDPDALRPEWERMQRANRARGYDPNQPRVSAGHSDGGQWTSLGSSGAGSGRIDAGEQPLVQQARIDRLIRPVQRGIEAALALFAALSARNTPDRRAVLEFNAREFRLGESGDLGRPNVSLLNRDQVRNACPRLGEVQDRTNRATAFVRASGGIMSPQQFGTAVHTNLKRQIDRLNDRNFRAEVSYLKNQIENYGKKDSIRIDVLEKLGNGTVCVYDIKTGRSGLSPTRMVEIVKNVFGAFPEAHRIIVSEVRPNR